MTEVDQVVFRLDAGFSVTHIAAIPGLKREVIAVSLPRAEHQVGSSPGSAGGLPERMLSRYRVLSEIGHGGMGVVYHAFDRTLEREVALKVLPPHRVSDPEWRRLFLQEARSAASLACPHICAIHDFGEADGVPYISMELIRGESLLDILRRSRLPRGRFRPSSCRSSLPPRRALALATEIAQALAQAHEHGIAHLDLKPANVMVSEHGHAKLIDFGLASLVEPKESAHGEGGTQSGGTSPGRVCGTLAYMSPEQICGLAVDHRSDIFTFGVLLHEMLTGANPLWHRTHSEARVVALDGPVPPVELPGPTDVASGLQRVLDRCLETDPRRRYQSMRAVIADLGLVRLGARGNASSRSTALLRLGKLFAALIGLAGLLLTASDAASTTIPAPATRRSPLLETPAGVSDRSGSLSPPSRCGGLPPGEPMSTGAGPSSTDRELVDRYKATANPIHLGELFERYTHLVLGVCLRSTIGRYAEDAVMEIYELLTTALLKHEVVSLKGWLYPVVANHWRMILCRLQGRRAGSGGGLRRHPHTPLTLTWGVC